MRPRPPAAVGEAACAAVVGAALGAATPLIANFAQIVAQPVARDRRSARRRRARAGGPLGARLCRDRAAARRARGAAADLRRGLGAIGAPASSKARSTAASSWRSCSPSPASCASPGVVDAHERPSPGSLGADRSAPLVFPFAQTLIGSADGTPPFFGRLRDGLSRRRAPTRAAPSSASAALLAYSVDLAAASGGVALSRCVRRRRARLCRRRLLFDARASSPRASDASCRPGASMRSAPCSAASSPARSAGISMPRRSTSSSTKFWAYADVNYRARRPRARRFHHLSDLQQIRRGQPRRGRRRRAPVLGRVGFRRDQLVARRAAVLDQFRAADGAAAIASLAPDSAGCSARGRRRAGRAGRARDALGPLDGADHQYVPAPVARSDLVQSGRRGADAGGDRRRRRPCRPATFRDFSLIDLPGPARLRLAARDHLVRPHGPARRDAGQSVVPRRRPRRRSGGAISRPRRAHARDSRRHSPLRHLGAVADPVLHSARRGLGQGLERRGGARAAAARCRRRSRLLAIAYAVAGAGIGRGASSVAARLAPEAGRASRSRCRARPPRWPTMPHRLSSQQWRRRRRNLARRARRGDRDGRTSAAASRSTSSAGRSIPLQARGHFFYLSEDGRSAVVDRLSSRRAAPANTRSTQTGFNRVEIANTSSTDVRATMEVAPDARGRGAELAHPSRPIFPAGRAGCV